MTRTRTRPRPRTRYRSTYSGRYTDGYRPRMDNGLKMFEGLVRFGPNLLNEKID